MKLNKKITNREFKLLLKPEGLDRRSRINQLISLFTSFCERSEVDLFHLDNASTGLRSVYFFDTPGEDFRRNNLILRVRESRQNVWIDDWCEVTLKCRASSLKE
jgi:inorganic triphosphatase YgiF